MLNKLVEIIDSPFKSLTVTVVGTITGYIPITTNTLMSISSTTIDRMFQHTVWTLTSVVAITAIVSWVQKQIEREKKRRKVLARRKKPSIYDSYEDDDGLD